MMTMRSQKQHQQKTTPSLTTATTTRYECRHRDQHECECERKKQNDSLSRLQNQDDTHRERQNDTLHKQQKSTATIARTLFTQQQQIKRNHLAANFLLLIPLLIAILINNDFSITNQVNCVSVHEVRFIESKSGRTDYALTSETIELSCHHLMKDHLEDVKQLIWSKDGQNFIRWRKGEPGLKIIGYTFKGHIDNASTNHHIIIHNVSIEMHGKYKCSIRTDLGLDENERNVVIIQQPQCKLGGWRIKAEPTKCRETLALDCRQMFPKPEPSCSLWNGKLDKTIMGLNVDISEESSNSFNATDNNLASSSSSSSLSSPTTTATATKRQKTYRVRYVQKFDLLSAQQQQQQQTLAAITNSSSSSGSQLVMKKPISPDFLLQFAGNLWFKCDIVVPETSWKLSLVLKLFDHNDACLEDPIEAIARWRLNYSQYIANQIQQKAQPQQQQQQSNAWSSAAFDPHQHPNQKHPHHHNHNHHQMDDFELLSSPVSNDLKYELIFPHTNNLGITKYKQAELNCWKKPKLGSLAKLSCINKFQLTQQVRFKGVNLLKCGPSGWFPLRGGGGGGSSFAASSRVNANSRPRNGREILKQPYSSNTTATPTPPSLNNSNSSLEGKIPQKNVSVSGMMTDPAAITAAAAAVTYIQDVDSNDLDDNNNNDDDNAPELVQISPTTTATATTTTNHKDDDGGDDDDDDGDESSSSVVIIPAFNSGSPLGGVEQDDIVNHVVDGVGVGVYRSHQQKHLSNLVVPTDHVDPLLSNNIQPSELASLLPTCISPRARLHQQLQRPLLHDEHLRTLESSAATTTAKNHDRSQPKQPSSTTTTTTTTTTDDDTGFGFGDLKSMFNFSFSSSSSSSATSESYCGYCDIRTITMCCCCLTAALFFINTMMITNN